MKIAYLLLTAACYLSTAVYADALCEASYFNGTAPAILKEKMSAKIQEICYQGYATKFSGVTRNPL